MATSIWDYIFFRKNWNVSGPNIGPVISLGLLFATFLSQSCGGGEHPKGKLPLGVVDSVTSGTMLHGIVMVQGWAIAEDGVRDVCLYLDRTQISCTQEVGGLRPDVAKVFPAIPGADKAGWGIRFDTSSITPGTHELVVQATSKAGAVRDLTGIPVGISR